MDPITIGALVMIGSLALGATCGVSGAAIQRIVHGRSGPGDARRKMRRLELENKKLEEINSAQAEELGRERKAREQQEGFKNQYRLIAQSHEVKLPQVSPVDEYEWVPVRNFSPRRYDMDINKALEVLERDLVGLDDDHLEVTFRIWLGPKWVLYMKSETSWDFEGVTENLSGFGRMDSTFTGPGGEIAEEIQQHVKDAAWGLRVDESGWKWRCCNDNGKHPGHAPVRIELNVRRQRPVEVSIEPEVHTMEVAVVEERVVEREVERVRYVVWDDPTQQAVVVDDEPRKIESVQSALQLTQEELIDIVQSVVEIELESRGGSMKAPTLQELAEVKARAKAAASRAMASKAQAAGGRRG